MSTLGERLDVAVQGYPLARLFLANSTLLACGIRLFDVIHLERYLSQPADWLKGLPDKMGKMLSVDELRKLYAAGRQELAYVFSSPGLPQKLTIEDIWLMNAAAHGNLLKRTLQYEAIEHDSVRCYVLGVGSSSQGLTHFLADLVVLVAITPAEQEIMRWFVGVPLDTDENRFRRLSEYYELLKSRPSLVNNLEQFRKWVVAWLRPEQKRVDDWFEYFNRPLHKDRNRFVNGLLQVGVPETIISIVKNPSDAAESLADTLKNWSDAAGLGYVCYRAPRNL